MVLFWVLSGPRRRRYSGNKYPTNVRDENALILPPDFPKWFPDRDLNTPCSKVWSPTVWCTGVRFTPGDGHKFQNNLVVVWCNCYIRNSYRRKRDVTSNSSSRSGEPERLGFYKQVDGEMPLSSNRGKDLILTGQKVWNKSPVTQDQRNNAPFFHHRVYSTSPLLLRVGLHNFSFRTYTSTTIGDTYGGF